MGSLGQPRAPSLLETSPEPKSPTPPPTPPRKANHDDIDALPMQVVASQQLCARLNLHTPPSVFSPTSSSSSTARRKKVGFCSQAEYRDPPVYVDGDPTRHHPTPVSVPTSSSRPVKSILKVTTAPRPTDQTSGMRLDSGSSEQGNIAEMLESTQAQLSGSDRLSKLDAYQTLSRALKASNNLPDRIALQPKMGLFVSFIERDIASSTADGLPDSTLAKSAISLLHAFLVPGIASSIPHESCVCIADHCIRAFQDEHLPKDIVLQLMKVAVLQNFPSDVMTADRVGHLITALHNIEDHISGRSVIQARIRIYKKLVKQCPQQMIFHSDWLQDMFTDMLSSARGIRADAIDLGFEAAFTLNKDKKLTSRVLETLNISLNDIKYIEHIAQRLDRMLQSRDESPSAPQIWSVIILFVPCPDQWDYFQPWFRIIQQCLNASDLHTRQEANLAWCRFAYRIHLDGRFSRVATLLRQGLESQVKRKPLRTVILGSICNTFYYGFKPAMNLNHLDDLWDLSVRPLMQKLLEQASQDDPSTVLDAASILTGLFDCRTRRVWREDHIVEKPLAQADELPAIDAKWLRRNPTRVFELVDQILAKTFSDLSTDGSKSNRLWRALVSAVASASVKDIKLHDDTAKFVAHVFSSLASIWTRGPSTRLDGPPCSSSQFLDSTRKFILTLVDELGLLPNPFTEKSFSWTKQNSFVISSTTSHRSSKTQPLRRLPLHHLFCILTKLPPGVPDNEEFAKFLRLVFAPFFDSRNLRSVKGRFELALEFLRLLPANAPCPYGSWALISEVTVANLESGQHSQQTTDSGSEPPVGHEYREIVKVLECGLRLTPNLPWGHWHLAFETFSCRVKTETGDAGLAIAVIEPLAKGIRDVIGNKGQVIPSNLVQAAVELIMISTHPRDKQAVDAARRRVWGTPAAGPRSASFDPFNDLYKLVNLLLERLYDSVESYGSKHIVSFLHELGNFLGRWNSHLSLRSLTTVQAGLAIWLEDKEHRITRSDYPDVLEATQSLWQVTFRLVSDLSEGQSTLASLEDLLCAAFRSTHRETVIKTADMWNRLYDNVDNIVYPEALKTVLLSLGTSVDVVRPGLHVPDGNSGLEHPRFTDFEEEVISSVKSPVKVDQNPGTRPSRRSATTGSAKMSRVAMQSRGATPLASTKSKGRVATPRLRHDDSQVQFAPIASSPANITLDSQLLTDRQKEIRDRQRETAALFPEMRSSSPADRARKSDSAAARETSSGEVAHERRASTPEPDGEFEDYLTSTPTPRRGQPVILPEQDQEMADAPSSPPEPRSFQLLSELSSKSNSNRDVDEWQFSSSPVSGSPNPAHQVISSSQPMDLDDVEEHSQLDGEQEAQSGETADSMPDQRSDAEFEGHAVEDSAIIEEPQEDIHISSGPILSREVTSPSLLKMASRSLRPRSTQGTPKSDHMGTKTGLPNTPSSRSLRRKKTERASKPGSEEFVDAPTSPFESTPTSRPNASRASGLRRSPRTQESSKSQLFEVSDADERSMMRLVVQVESKKFEGVPSHDDALPENPDTPGHKEQEQQPEILDCITVGGEERPQKSRSGRSQKSKSPAASRQQQDMPSTPVDEAMAYSSQEISSQKTPSSKGKKRKRSPSKVSGSGGRKRKRQAPEHEAERIPDSQTVAIMGDTEMPTMDELYAKDVSISSGKDSEQTSPVVEEASQLPVVHGNAAGQAEEPSDEEAVQSQLALEEQQQARKGAVVPEQEKPVPPADAGASGEAEVADGPPSQDITEVSDEQTEAVAQGPPSSAQPDQKHGGARKTDTLGDLMHLLRGSLDILRSANLKREEVYQVEDMFMDMKHELFEAERRGRRL